MILTENNRFSSYKTCPGLLICNCEFQICDPDYKQFTVQGCNTPNPVHFVDFSNIFKNLCELQIIPNQNTTTLMSLFCNVHQSIPKNSMKDQKMCESKWPTRQVVEIKKEDENNNTPATPQTTPEHRKTCIIRHPNTSRG